jgi:hypothetical protein
LTKVPPAHILAAIASGNWRHGRVVNPASALLSPSVMRDLAGCCFYSALAAILAASASAETAQLSAEILSPHTQPPSGQLELPPANGLPSFHCDDQYCGFDFLRDAWKRGISKDMPHESMNADTIIVARSRFIAEGQRWAQTTPVFRLKIPGLPCTVGGYMSGENFGIGCGF